MSYLDELYQLDGKIALVTGAGQGIGEAVSLALMRCGVTVILAGRTRSKLERVAEEAKDFGGKCAVLKMDIAAPQEISDGFAWIKETYGQLDILINNAGITIKNKAEDLSLEDWRAVIDTNLTGTFLCAQSAANMMLPRRSGKIINVISTYAFVGRDLRAAYSASKGGELQMTKTMAIEWASRGVNVNALAPTATLTPMTSVYGTDAQAREVMERKIPMGRLAVPEDMVGAALFLASSASDFITGHAILVDGGFTAI